MASSERVFKLLDTPPEILPPAAPRAVPAASAGIEFDHVWFAYKDEDWVLRDVSFRIDPGETVAVVGHTGAGKTTLISLLLRFYDVQQGAIRIGGVDIRDVDPLELRRQFRRGACRILICSPARIEDNIRLGTEGIEREDVEDAAEQVNLMDFIRSLPDGFEQHDSRARQFALHRTETAHQFRARAGAQSALSDSGRSHVERGYGNRVPRARGAGAAWWRAGRRS